MERPPVGCPPAACARPDAPRGPLSLPASPGSKRRHVLRSHAARPEGPGLAAGAKRAHLGSLLVVSESRSHHGPARQRPREDRVGDSRCVDRVLRLSHELLDQLDLALHGSLIGASVPHARGIERPRFDPTSVRGRHRIRFAGTGSSRERPRELSYSSPSAPPTPCTRLNSGCGTIPNKIVATPASTATKASSG
jgi:hypothetical protein